LRLKDETLERLGQGITVRTSFDVKPGTYLIRLVVRDAEGQKLSATNGAVAATEPDPKPSDNRAWRMRPVTRKAGGMERGTAAGPQRQARSRYPEFRPRSLPITNNTFAKRSADSMVSNSRLVSPRGRSRNTPPALLGLWFQTKLLLQGVEDRRTIQESGRQVLFGKTRRELRRKCAPTPVP
jgi:hypothetical protein